MILKVRDGLLPPPFIRRREMVGGSRVANVITIGGIQLRRLKRSKITNTSFESCGELSVNLTLSLLFLQA